MTQDTKNGMVTTAMMVLLGALVLMTVGCSHAFDEYGKAVGCTIAGNGCGANDGATGPQGPQGIAGLSVVGPIGPSGPAGANGTQISFVNLCPGTTTYPSQFVEVAICVNGQDLYGVYSANNGFLTFFPQGAYTSNAIGAACNLVIGPNCTVTH